MAASDGLYVSAWALWAVVIAAALLGYALAAVHGRLDRHEARKAARAASPVEGAGPPVLWQPEAVYLHELPAFVRAAAWRKGIARRLVQPVRPWGG